MKKIVFLGVLGAVVLALCVFSIRLGDYPDLKTCFKASVSKQMLCAQSSNYVPLEKVSKNFLKAVVMSEDDSFYAHDGFDWKEFRKSMATNLRQFAFVRGGSTITQQLVKNVYLSQKKTITRKIIEAKLASKVEKENSKKLILEKYVNAIEFGKDIWGIKKAARFYFDKSPLMLDPLESLYLVILLPSPVKYSQTYFKKELSAYQKRRMKALLSRMMRRGFISIDEYEESEKRLEYFFKGPPVEKVQAVENFLGKESDAWAETVEEDKVELPEEGEFEDEQAQEEGERYFEEEGVVEDADLDLGSEEAEVLETAPLDQP